MKRSLLSATIAATIALIPFSIYAVSRAQDDGSTNSRSVHASADTIQFNLVPAAPQIAKWFTNAILKVSVSSTEDELGTDTFTTTAKSLRPNTTFAVFRTELPLAPFGAVQYIADFTTTANGKGSVQVNATIEEAFSSQVVKGQRVRKELNHVVFWFANPADANECFAPADALMTVFDGDGVAGPPAFSSQDTLDGAPLP